MKRQECTIKLGRLVWVKSVFNTGRFIMFSVITNIYNKKTPNAEAEPSTLLLSTSIAL
jgi:hypothetical protein